MRRSFLFAALIIATCVGAGLSATRGAAADLNTLTQAEKDAGWKLLFDGRTTEGWRNFKRDQISEGWTVRDGALVRSGDKAGDILTTGTFESFELSIEYNISPGGNSGIMYHVTEEAATPWMTGPEIQIQDNVQGRDPQKAGWLYQLYKSETDSTKPAGEWNQLRIVISPQKCSHTMNGVLYCEYVKGSSDWDERVAQSKFGKMPLFGKPTRGHISLQDHGNLVMYRNIKIREIK